MDKTKTKKIKVHECQNCGRIIKELLGVNKESLDPQKTGNPMRENFDELTCGCCRRESFKVHHFSKEDDDNKILVEILKNRLAKW